MEKMVNSIKVSWITATKAPAPNCHFRKRIKIYKKMNTKAITAATTELRLIVKTYGEGNQVKILTSYMINSTDVAGDSLAEAKLYAGLKEFIGDDVSYASFNKDYKMSSSKVGPTIADDIKRSSVVLGQSP